MKRKWHVLCAGLACALALTVSTQVSYAADVNPAEVPGTTETTEATEATETPAVPVYTVKIKFNGNGGKGSMSKVTVSSDKTVKLKKNAYKRDGYTFIGWSTTKSGKVEYKDKADVTSLATKANNGSQITLYAQWKLSAPNIKKTTSTPAAITVKYSQNKSVSGYEIQYSTDKKFKEFDKKGVRKTFTKTVTDKNVTSAELLRVVPDKQYYVRVRSYRKSSGSNVYSDWSAVKSLKVKKGYTLTNLKAKNAAGIEADVKLNSTSGSGYHAKLVMGNATSAVSFGMQYDQGAEGQYAGKNMALIENISSNASGGQNYTRFNQLKLNKKYHLMMVSNGNGYVDVYIDYKKVGSCYQESMKNLAWFRIEAAGRLNGDKVNVEFSNIKLGAKSDGAANIKVLGDEYRDLKWGKISSNPGIKGKFDKKTNTIKFTGTIRDLHGDWDSDYERASGIFQFE